LPAFYYDIKKDIGTEKLCTALTETNKLSGDAPYGVTYTNHRPIPRTMSSRTGEATR